MRPKITATMNATKFGGTESSCAEMEEYPSPLMIVGRKSENEYAGMSALNHCVIGALVKILQRGVDPVKEIFSLARTRRGVCPSVWSSSSAERLAEEILVQCHD